MSRITLIFSKQTDFNINKYMSQSHATYIESHILRRFNIIKKVGSGAYGHVWKVEQKSTKRIFALKKIFDAFQHATDAQRTYREIEILRQTEHPNIIKLFDTIRADNSKDVYLLFEFMEADLHNVISEGILKDVHIRFIIYQLAKALKYLHTGSIIHRDLKPSNILVNSNCTIKLCDFGLVRSLINSKDTNAVLTEGVATRWYRAPEVLLGSKSYSTPADIWSFGCIVYEILAQKPLFAGQSTLDQIEKICSFTGYPSEEDINSLESEISKSMISQIKTTLNNNHSILLKEFSLGFVDLLEKILVFNPKKRLTIEQILNHEIVKAFHKPEEEICCEKLISTSIDDNKKFTVDEYRKLIYGINAVTVKPKALSASLGSGSNSAKYFNKSSLLHQSNSNSNSNSQIIKNITSQKPEITKKYSYQKFKSPNLSTGNQPSHLKEPEIADPKKFQRPVIKYVRSTKDFTNKVTSETSQSYHFKKSEINQKADIQNKEEENEQVKPSYESAKLLGNTYISKTFYSPKNIIETRPISNGPAVNSSGNMQNLAGGMSGSSWKSPKNLPTQQMMVSPKDKGILFKSPKYISTLDKNETSIKYPNRSEILAKKQNS